MVGRDLVRLSSLELSDFISLKMVEKWVRDGTIFGRGDGRIINREGSPHTTETRGGMTETRGGMTETRVECFIVTHLV